MFIQESAVLRPETIAIRELKRRIKDDAVNIRTHKKELRLTQRQNPNDWHTAVDQSNLMRERSLARARLLIYGVLRGKTWDQMEQKHTWNSWMKMTLTREFTAIQAYVLAESGQTLVMPDDLSTIITTAIS